VDANSGDKLNLRLTRQSGSAGVAWSSYSFIVLFDFAFGFRCKITQVMRVLVFLYQHTTTISACCIVFTGIKLDID